MPASHHSEEDTEWGEREREEPEQGRLGGEWGFNSSSQLLLQASHLRLNELGFEPKPLHSGSGSCCSWLTTGWIQGISFRV